jgi:hypothetical protein
MAGPNQLLIDILTRVTGTSDVKAHMKAVRDLSGGVNTLSQTYKMYEQGVKSALSGDEAVRKVLPMVSANLRETAGEASDAAREFDDFANSLTRADIAATNNASGLKTGRQAVNRFHNTAKSANYTVLSLAQTFQDSAQFSMGFAQGIRAITNNAQVFVQSLVTLSEKSQEANVSMKALLKEAFTGPTGIILVFSIVTATIEIVASKFGGLSKAVRAANEEVKNASEVFNPFVRMGFESSEALQRFTKVLVDFRRQDFAAMAAEVGRDMRGLTRQLQDDGIDLGKFFDSAGVGLSGFFGQMGKSNALRKLTKDLEEQAESAKAIEEMWTVLTTIFTEAGLEQRRLAYETVELTKKTQESGFWYRALSGQVKKVTQDQKNYRSELAKSISEEQRLSIRKQILKVIDNERDIVVKIRELEKLSADERQRYFDIKREEAVLNENDLEIKLRAVDAAEREQEIREKILELIGFYNTESGKTVLYEEYKTDLYKQQAAAIADLVARIQVLKNDPQILQEQGVLDAQEEVVSLSEELERLQGKYNEYVNAQGNSSVIIEKTNAQLATQRTNIALLKESIDRLNGVDLSNLHLQLLSILESGFENAIIDLASAFGSSGNMFANGAASILKSIGTLAINLGKAMIKFAIVGTVLDRFAQGDFKGALPVGIALIALGAALKGKAASMVSSQAKMPSSSVSAPTTGSASFVSGAPRTAASLQGVSPSVSGYPVFSGRFVASGRDLVAVVGTEITAQQEIGIRNPLNITG